MLGGSGKDRMIEVDLDDFAHLEPLLSAEVHLVDITMDFGTMNRASEKTYAGISAEFCQLDWAIHKKDPSSGELVVNEEASDVMLWVSLIVSLPLVIL